MDEEERGALWRSQRVARAQAEEGRRRALTGDPGKREELDGQWLAYYLGQLEANSPEEEMWPPDPLPPQL